MSDDRCLVARHEYVPLAELDAATMRISIAPLPTVFMFAMGAVTDRREVSKVGPAGWRQAVRSQLRTRDVETLSPLADPRTTGWPEVLTLGDPAPGVRSFETDLDAILAIDSGQFLAQLDDGWGERADSWRAARKDPRRWIRDYASTIRRVWNVVEPLWARARPRLDREPERVGAAMALGAVGQCIDTLHPRSSIKRGEWCFAAQGRARWGIAKDFIVSPLVAEDAVTLAVDEASTTLTHMSYPLPGAWWAFGDEHPPPASLAGLLGAQRARILLRLERPATVGEVASAMYATQGAATYQLRALESAGLVTRSRRGRSVAVERTDRGTKLLELYADAD